MKKILTILTLLILSCFSGILAQEERLPARWEGAPDKKQDYPPDSLIIVEFPDSIAEFPGGNEALLKFIPTNMVIPDSLKLAELQGRVFVRFVIETDGSVTNPEILRGIHPIIDREILKTVKKMPRWRPAYHQGKAVRSRYIVPVKIIYD